MTQKWRRIVLQIFAIIAILGLVFGGLISTFVLT